MAVQASRTLSGFMFVIFVGLCLLPLSFSLPFVFLHGLGSSCSTPNNSNFTKILRTMSGTDGDCLEIGDCGGLASMILPVMKQVEIACEKVKADDTLRDGYNLVAHSQGNMVARGLIEFCDGAPKVNNYISIAGPQAGEASIPSFECESGPACDIIKGLIALIKHAGIYSDVVQELVAPAGYIKIPNDTGSYFRGSSFLPYVNNEIVTESSAKYKERFASLEKLALIMFDNDTVIIPKESSWFGFYPDCGSTESPIVPTKETKLYTEDWIGLKTLDEAGKVEFITAPGEHASLTSSLAQRYVVPYLK